MIPAKHHQLVAFYLHSMQGTYDPEEAISYQEANQQAEIIK